MSDCPVNTDRMRPIDSIEGDSVIDTNLLKEMATEAHEFMREQDWCERIDQQYLAYGVGGVVGVFLFQITPRYEDVDPCLWVIVGDLPPAYIVVDGNPTVADALDAYCFEMEAWVKAADKGESVDNLIPVNVPATPENAQHLDARLRYLRSEIIPLARAF
jgi:hypothetical protein